MNGNKARVADAYYRASSTWKGDTMNYEETCSLTTQKELVLVAGLIIKVKGAPFELKEDTVVLGCQANFNIAMKEDK